MYAIRSYYGSYYADNNENMISGGLSFTDKKIGNAAFSSSYLDRGAEYSGIQNTIKSDLKLSKWNINLNGGLLNSSTAFFDTRFLRHSMMISRNLRFVDVGVGENAEDNLWNIRDTDSIAASSYKFSTYLV